MTTCPKCGATLKDEYGMSQCPACGTFSFIGMDGEAVIQESSPDSESVSPSVSPSESQSEPEVEPEFEPLPSPVPGPGGAAAEPDFSDPIEGLIDVSSRDVVEPVDDFQSFDPFASMETPAPAFGPANDPLNLNEFANSEISSAKDGPLLFRVLISGIDTKEIRESIREVLQDSRFAWDSNEIFSKVRQGHLAIDNLSPVKASILVTRLKRLPIQIRWEQYAISQGHI